MAGAMNLHCNWVCSYGSGGVNAKILVWAYTPTVYATVQLGGLEENYSGGLGGFC